MTFQIDLLADDYKDKTKAGIHVRIERTSGLAEAELWDCVLNESGKPRLSKSKKFFSPLTQGSIPLLVEGFQYWRDYVEYLVVKAENERTGEEGYYYKKCSKRGNDVFAERLESNLNFLKLGQKVAFFKASDFKNRKKRKHVKTRLLWVTLTYNPKLRSLAEAWDGRGECVKCGHEDLLSSFSRIELLDKNGSVVYEKKLSKSGKKRAKKVRRCVCGGKVRVISGVAYEFNLWITRLRQEYGHVWYVAFPQAFPDMKGEAFGYPHLHVIMLFEDHEFRVFPNFEANEDTGKKELAFRILERDEINYAGQWPAFTDIKAVSNVHAVYNYARKYCQNVAHGKSSEATINNAVMWLFSKRSFNLSGKFRESYHDLIRGEHDSKGFQVDLLGIEASLWKFSLVGVFSAGELNLEDGDPPWFGVLEPDLVHGLCGGRRFD
jgi:hypothetical protein